MSHHSNFNNANDFNKTDLLPPSKPLRVSTIES